MKHWFGNLGAALRGAGATAAPFCARLTGAAIAAAAAVASLSVQAAVVSWDTSIPGDGLWRDNTRWVGGLQPQAGAEVVLPGLAGGYTVTLVATPPVPGIASLLVSSSQLVVTQGVLDAMNAHVVEGSIQIRDAGSLIGLGIRNSGSVAVSGHGSTLAYHGYTGGQDVSMLSVTAGAQALIDQGFSTGSGNWSVVVDDGLLRADTFDVASGGGITVRNGATVQGGWLRQTGGQLNLDHGTLNMALIDVSGSGELGGRGALVGPPGQTQKVSIVDGGTLSTPFGEEISLGGDLLCRNGTLRAHIGGKGPGQFGVLDVAGLLDLANCRVLIDFFDGYVPDAGDIMDFIQFGSIGNFDQRSFGVVGASGDFAIQQAGNSLRFVALTGFSVPLPGTLVLTMAALVLLAGTRRGERR